MEQPRVRLCSARAAALFAALALVAVGCVGTDADDSVSVRAEDLVAGSGLSLPERSGERVVTSGDVPHVQLDVAPVADVDAELRRRAFLFPGVSSEPSGVSLPGAVQIALDPGLDLARPAVISSSGEFAHIHPDGSLHVWLPVDAAAEVHDQKWGERHPWVGRDGFWDGVVMVYTPQTLAEVDIAIRILAEAYNFVVGEDLDADDID